MVPKDMTICRQGLMAEHKPAGYSSYGFFSIDFRQGVMHLDPTCSRTPTLMAYTVNFMRIV